MHNCIIYGNLTNEFETDLKTAAVMNYTFGNCFIKSDKDLSDVSHYISISQNVDPGFEDTSLGKLKLVSGSACIGAANNSTSLPDDDIDDKVRDGSPDVGCYEY